MAKYRQGRINDEVQKEMAQIVREIKDPRVSGKMICITAAQVTPDLKFAKIYYSVLGGDKKEVAAGLKAASGFIRRQIAQRLNLRITPEFTFLLDESIEYGAHIASILNTIEFSDDDEPAEDSGDEA
jgi:ribosome-binding factor A